MYIWCIFVRSRAVAPPCRPPPSTWFYCHYRPLKGVRSPVELWSPVQSGANQNTDRFPVPGHVECRGGRFSVGPDLWLFLSGPLEPHPSGQVPKTCGLYSMVTHHACYSLCGPGSFNLDLISLPLLVRKWGSVLPHPVCEAPHSSWFI
jgi:hypothetical protein